MRLTLELEVPRGREEGRWEGASRKIELAPSYNCRLGPGRGAQPLLRTPGLMERRGSLVEDGDQGALIRPERVRGSLQTQQAVQSTGRSESKASRRGSRTTRGAARPNRELTQGPSRDGREMGETPGTTLPKGSKTWEPGAGGRRPGGTDSARTESEVACRLQQAAALIQRESNLGQVREALSPVWNRKENVSDGESQHSEETF
jgi:hypothetical protein